MGKTDNELAWLWAVNENLWLLDKHDGYLIHRVKNRKFNVEDLELFFKNYSLLRWLPKFAHEKKWMQHIIDVCDKVYSEPLPKSGYWGLAKERWFKVMDKLKKRSGGEKTLWSASMKLYWLYQPDKLPMYDTYVRNSLAKIAIENGYIKTKSGLIGENFLDVFSRFYQASLPEIKLAIKTVPRKYPYPTRVAEKYLWLLGAEDMNDRIRNFEASLIIAPL